MACILAEGPGAVDLVQTLVRTKSGRLIDDLPDDRLVLRHFGDETGEEIVLRRRGPQSVELYCHGGRAAAAKIGDALQKLGFRITPWQAWVSESQADPIAAAALVLLADAPTLRTAGI